MQSPRYWLLACRIKVTPMLFYVSGMFIMMTVTLFLTGPIKYGQEERQANEAGTGGVSPVGQEHPSTSIN